MLKRSRLGVEEKVMGNLLSGAGLFHILAGYFLLTGFVDRFGFYKSMKIRSFFSIPVVNLIPLSLLTNRDAVERTLAWSTLVLVSLLCHHTRVLIHVLLDIDCSHEPDSAGPSAGGYEWCFDAG